MLQSRRNDPNNYCVEKSARLCDSKSSGEPKPELIKTAAYKQQGSKMRFGFGKNWRSFSAHALSPARIESAKSYFYRLLTPQDLAGRSFFDVGFGQGLSLCLAAESGATARGIDIDPDNLEALRTTSSYFTNAPQAEVQIGSILDAALVEAEMRRGAYDIVHSWGVLHHTGSMHQAISNCMRLVKPGGLFIVSIYNRHWSSPFWRAIKWCYNKSPSFVQQGLVALFFPIIFAAKLLVTWENPFKKERGMDFYHDVVDWVGGYPYEYATPRSIKAFIEEKGFQLARFFPAQVPTGCNEFVFRRIAAAD